MAAGLAPAEANAARFGASAAWPLRLAAGCLVTGTGECPVYCMGAGCIAAGKACSMARSA